MDQNNQNYEEVEIDLGQYIKAIVKRKKTFIAIFLLTLAIGLANIQFSPKIHRISMMIQPPVSGEVLTGANDLESAENLKGLIINGAFNEELKEKLKLDLNMYALKFAVVIPDKTNILQVSVDLESKKKEFGVALLQSLNDLISASYAKRIEARTSDIASQIKLNERAIVNSKEKAKNLQDQINEITAREDKLREEIKTINANTAQILDKREELLKNSATVENTSLFLLTNFIQNNLSYSNQLNNQFSDLSIRRANLNLEIKNIDSQISDFQMAIDKLNANKVFVSNLRVISQPRVAPNPVNSGKKKTLTISIVMGLFFGLLTVFLQEFRLNNLAKK